MAAEILILAGIALLSTGYLMGKPNANTLCILLFGALASGLSIAAMVLAILGIKALQREDEVMELESAFCENARNKKAPAGGNQTWGKKKINVQLLYTKSKRKESCFNEN